MARKTRSTALESRSARTKLAAGKYHWRGTVNHLPCFKFAIHATVVPAALNVGLEILTHSCPGVFDRQRQFRHWLVDNRWHNIRASLDHVGTNFNRCGVDACGRVISVVDAPVRVDPFLDTSHDCFAGKQGTGCQQKH